MRDAFAQAVIGHFSGPDTFFLTGDLGFMALEKVRGHMAERFVNCGVAEQNMIGTAAGLAREGFRVFAYSIAPFCYARPYEQIRNDICFNRLPVILVGNGGGYAYGYMGPTHHALEDCAALLALPEIRALVPAFDADLVPMLGRARDQGGPVYLRLGYEVRPENFAAPAYAPWRCLLAGEAGAMAALGPLAGLAVKALEALPERERPSVWAVTELPLENLPEDFAAAVAAGGLAVVEEHVAQGGLGMALALALARAGSAPAAFVHRPALRYPSGRYGSQAFHRHECGLDEEGLRRAAAELRRLGSDSGQTRLSRPDVTVAETEQGPSGAREADR